MRNGVQILENASALCAMFRTSYQTSKLCVGGDLENLSVDQVDFSNRKLSFIRYLQKIMRGSTSLTRRFSRACLWAVPCTRGQIGMETYSLRTLSLFTRNWSFRDAHRKTQRKRSSPAKKLENVFPCADGSLQLAWTGYGV